MAEQEVRIAIDDGTAGGQYSNLAVIAHNENEFIMDFIFAHPPNGRVNARIIMSPAHAKRFLRALSENVTVYERSFQPIKEAPEPPKLGLELSPN